MFTKQSSLALVYLLIARNGTGASVNGTLYRYHSDDRLLVCLFVRDEFVFEKREILDVRCTMNR